MFLRVFARLNNKRLQKIFLLMGIKNETVETAFIIIMFNVSSTSHGLIWCIISYLALWLDTNQGVQQKMVLVAIFFEFSK